MREGLARGAQGHRVEGLRSGGFARVIASGFVVAGEGQRSAGANRREQVN